ncbi:DUF4145 domain-containing protein [Yersinia enterocolitica]|uniref:DUF4145 domain-containing protein n=1 Tax=Yersinia pseudotuberculosis TaxID=633 RepID=UPI0005E52303|nr:DUF4145 domain-containing protein [Yersinia pseudotuberculosis]CND63022.1 Uncharacterised protein [Yersinia pseudotuberculosis]
MIELKIFKAPCPSCRGNCKTIVHGETKTQWEHQADRHNFVYGGSEHKLLECCGCSTVFYYKDSWNSEGGDYDIDGQYVNEHDIETVPAPTKKSVKPEWIDLIHKQDQVLYRILGEVYTAYEHQAFILASTGLRTAFDRASVIIGIPAYLPLEQKVKAVFEQGYVSETECEQLNIVTNAGNASAHRGWMPDESAFESLLRVTEKFIHRVVLRDHKVEEIGAQIPKRPRKGHVD